VGISLSLSGREGVSRSGFTSEESLVAWMSLLPPLRHQLAVDDCAGLGRTHRPECLGELRLHTIWEHVSHLCQRGRGGLFIIENGVCQPWTGFEPRDVDRLLHFTADHHFCWSRLYSSHVRMAAEITSNCRRAASIKEGTITSEVGIFYGKHISFASSHQSLSERYPNAVYATRYLPQQPWKEG
jgi:hypothetical protein